MKKIVVLYHGDCWDGFGGAWAAWKKFGKRASYIGLNHDGTADKVVSGLRNREIYVIDFSFPENEYPEVMEKLVTYNKVVALDHHISGEKATKLAHEYRYALNHSGATIAWKYFHPKKKTPKLLLYIEDNDLWKFKLRGAKEISSYMQMFNYNFKLFSKLLKTIERPASRKKFIEKGLEILKYQDELISRLLENATLVKFAGYRTLAVNAPIFRSEIGHLLAKKEPPIGIVWYLQSNNIMISLRSNGKVDVSKIAERFGGGGHKGAAGFAIPLGQKLPWKIIK